jgi:UDP-glucose 4-epimerase
MKILVTGAAGFIANHLITALLENSHTVVGVDNFLLGKPENIVVLQQNPRFRFQVMDVLSPDLLDLFEKERFEAVFHLAANSDISQSHADPDIDLNHTFLTTYHVLKAMKAFAVKQIIFASSSAIYGEVQSDIGEDHGPLFPKSHYGAAKLASEAFIASFSANYNIQAWLVRFPNVVGAGLTHGVVYDFIRKLKADPAKLLVLGNGQQKKPYVSVNDLVEAILLIWEKTKASINYYNVGVQSTTQVDHIAKLVIEAMGLQPEVVYSGGQTGWVGDVPYFQYKLDKIRQLGWQSKYTSDEAIVSAIEANCR